MRTCLMVMLALGVAAPSAFGQYPPYPGSVPPPPGPRERRAARERAVAHVGPAARPLVETYGEPAVAALFTCSLPVARKLCEYETSGGLKKCHDPARLLQVIGQPGHGDDVALWAMNEPNERQLRDKDCLEAFLLDPLSYALGLKNLDAGASELRVKRLAAPTPGTAQASVPGWDWRAVAVAAAVVGVFALVWWKKRQAT